MSGTSAPWGENETESTNGSHIGLHVYSFPIERYSLSLGQSRPFLRYRRVLMVISTGDDAPGQSDGGQRVHSSHGEQAQSSVVRSKLLQMSEIWPN
jgi:hypothetical protein